MVLINTLLGSVKKELSESLTRPTHFAVIHAVYKKRLSDNPDNPLYHSFSHKGAKTVEYKVPYKPKDPKSSKWGGSFNNPDKNTAFIKSHPDHKSLTDAGWVFKSHSQKDTIPIKQYNEEVKAVIDEIESKVIQLPIVEKIKVSKMESLRPVGVVLSFIKKEDLVNEALGTMSNIKAATKFGPGNIAKMDREEKARKAALSPKQQKIASLAGDKEKIDSDDLAKLRSMKKEEVELEEMQNVFKTAHSWGTLTKVYHNNDHSSHSYILHPEHVAAVKKLNDGESTKFTDETGNHVTAERKGETIHFTGSKLRTGSAVTTAHRKYFMEEVEQVNEYKMEDIHARHKAMLMKLSHHEFAQKYPPHRYSDESLRRKAQLHNLPINYYVEKRRKGLTEEVELDEGMPSGVIKDKQRLSQMTDQEFAQKYKDSTPESLRAKARTHAIKDPDHYIKRREAGLKEELELDEAKRGRPRKDGSKPANDDEGGREHIIVQLRKAENLRGNREIEFNDGKKHQLPLSHVKKALDMHVKMKPMQKGEFEARLAKSHSSFHDAVSGKPAEPAKPRVTLAKSAAMSESNDPVTTRTSDRGPQTSILRIGPDGRPQIVKRSPPRPEIKVEAVNNFAKQYTDTEEAKEEEKEGQTAPKGASADLTMNAKKYEKDPLFSKVKLKLPLTVGNKAPGGEDTEYGGGKYSVAEEKTLNSLYDKLDENNKKIFEDLIQTEEGVAKLMIFATEQGI